MIDKFVSACLERRWLMVALFLLIAAFGVYSWTELSVEAYPDISDTTAQVVTSSPGTPPRKWRSRSPFPWSGS